MDEDPEALVERRLARDPEDARELVLQRARPVGLDVRGAEQQAVAARGRNGSSDGSSRAAIGGRARRGRRARRRAAGRRASSSGGSRAARASRRGRIAALMPGSASATGWPCGAVQQRRELEQLEVAHDAVGDVEVGVEAQLAEARADARDVVQQLVAQRLVGRVQRLVGAEQLLLALLPLGAERGARLLGERRRRLQRARVGARRVGEHEPAARARHRDVQQPAHLGDVRVARVGRQRLVQQRVGDRLDRAAAARPASATTAARARRRGRTRSPCAPASHRHAPRDRAVAAPAASRARPVLVAQPGLGDRGDRARELARRRLRRAAHVRGRRARRGARARRSRSTTSAWAANSCWRRSPSRSMRRWTNRSGRVVSSARGGLAVELQEAEDPLARLGRQLRRLGRGDERGDHVELAPPRDLHAAREVDRAQLDRRPRERAHDGAGVARVDEQPQPGEHVADLGALEERRRADEPVGHRALLERDGDRLALVAHRAHEHGDPLGRRRPRATSRSTSAATRLRLRALVRAAPEARRVAAGAAPSSALGDPVGDRRDDRAARRRATRCGQRSDCSRRTTSPSGQLGGEVAQVLRRRAAEARGSPGRRRRRRSGSPCSPASSEHEPHRARSSRSWTSSTSTCRQRAGDARAHVRALAQQRERRAARGRRSRARPARRACGRARRRRAANSRSRSAALASSRRAARPPRRAYSVAR